MAAHHGKACIDSATLALVDFVNSGAHVVVDAAARDTAQRLEGARVSVKEHFVALAGVGHQPEGPTGAQLQVRHLQTTVDAADHQTFFAPVELEGFAQLERQRHEGAWRTRFATALTPGADEVGHARVASAIALGLDLRVQRPAAAPLMLGTSRIAAQSH